MTSDRHQRVRDLFHAACDLDKAKRDALLDETCGDDPALRSEVEALLARDADAHDAFAETGLGVGRNLLASEADGATPTTSTSHHGRFLPGTTVADRYRIVSLLGSGGMGEVYRADDLRLGQPVALKFLPPELSGSPRLLESFHNEVRLSRQIAHPNVCRVYDIGEVNGQQFLSMEYVDGEDLKQLLRRIGRLTGDKGVELARQLCRGLAAAHGKGVLHRDLKPANVMIDGQGQVRITDFGLARLATDPGVPGEVAGTPAYMAPEQLSRGETTVQTDLYALGLILYEMFTGEAARKAGSIDEIRRHEAESPRFPSAIAREIDPRLELAILMCLSTDARERPPSARSVLAALPGGDALELALAAGETPSPEMVAAAGEGKGLPLKTGAICLVVALAGVVGASLLSRMSQELIDFDADTLVRTGEARELIGEFGYALEGTDAVWGLEWSTDYFEHFRASEEAMGEWSALTGGPPTAGTFWYRQYTGNLVPEKGRGAYFAMFVTRDDPPPLYPGMIGLSLDARGRLLEFLAPPALDVSPGSTGLDGTADAWRAKLLDAAGIDERTFGEEFVRSPERGAPPSVYADTREVWDSRSGNVRVELAAYEGRPVLFRLAPRGRTEPGEPPRVFGIVMAATVLTLFATSLILARRNWESGRADKRGAMRLFLFVVCASFVTWALQAHHVPGVGEQAMILETAARALLRGVLISAPYIGLEPYVRKLWPRTLVSWSRLLAGRFHDPIIGRDLLVGVLGALALQFIGSTGLVLGASGQLTVAADPAVRVGTGPFSLEPLLGPHVALGLLAQEMFAGVVGGLVTDLLFVLVLRLVLRKTWLAVTVVVLSFSLPCAVRGDLLVATVVALWVATSLFVFFRFGVLAVAAGWVAWRLLSWPVNLDLSSPHVDIGLVAYAAVAAMACYGFYSAVRLRRSDRGVMTTPSADAFSPRS